MVLRSQFEYLRETVQNTPRSTWTRPVQNKKWAFFFPPTVNAWLLLASLKACDWSTLLFPSREKTLAMSPFSTVHVGQHDTKYVTLELLLHVAFVADEIWGGYAWTSSYISCLIPSNMRPERDCGPEGCNRTSAYFLDFFFFGGGVSLVYRVFDTTYGWGPLLLMCTIRIYWPQ